MAAERLANLLAGSCIPQPRRPVPRCGDDALAVGTEHRAPHCIRMALERRAEWLGSLGIPQPRRVVLRRGDNALAVGAERRTPHNIGMAFKWFARDWVSHRRVVLSQEAVTTRLLSGL